MAYALGERTAHPDELDGECLTKREREIAVLVGEGLSNRDIAAELVISARTVETHVRHLMTKLGAGNRTQIATWVVATNG
ncbi:helix-turn-helix transcriptional regulator [Amycolatopsis umgeniensis]|uniref:DNA-binding NarL/FixJ family response regulator n=1 Tax=Amycolatopsis umgeniensis TaxID=336628 RepID=A0A841BAA6_9PSEU|nr:helix-turn-helix transcriptional regulator [Amycolatopsis umgeniensis]MBB5857799.1 DNA-binding NarL/FixJ family response regulator [Amycolatopsis umgeniensis]